jgi:hypothetical protein
VKLVPAGSKQGAGIQKSLILLITEFPIKTSGLSAAAGMTSIYL